MRVCVTSPQCMLLRVELLAHVLRSNAVSNVRHFARGGLSAAVTEVYTDQHEAHKSEAGSLFCWRSVTSCATQAADIEEQAYTEQQQQEQQQQQQQQQREVRASIAYRTTINQLLVDNATPVLFLLDAQAQ